MKDDKDRMKRRSALSNHSPSSFPIAGYHGWKNCLRQLPLLLMMILLAEESLQAQTDSTGSTLHRAAHPFGFKFGVGSGFGLDYSNAWFGAEVDSWLLVLNAGRVRFYPLQTNFTPYVGVGAGQIFQFGHGRSGIGLWMEAIAGIEYGRKLTVLRLQYQQIVHPYNVSRDMTWLADLSIGFPL
jgi:hypothetical protein